MFLAKAAQSRYVLKVFFFPSEYVKEVCFPILAARSDQYFFVCFQVNGTAVTPSVIPVDGVEIYYSGKLVVLETSFGLVVRFNGDHRVDVTVPSTYKGELCGMCGRMTSLIHDKSVL